MPGELTHTIANPHCPGCHYDLSSIVASWQDQCPLQGTCSECGDTFAWNQLLRPELARVPWLYEHAAHWWNIKKLLITYMVVLAPNWFWKQVRPDHPIRLRRHVLLFFFVLYCVNTIYITLEPVTTYVMYTSFANGAWGTWQFSFTESIIDALTFPFVFLYLEEGTWVAGELFDIKTRDILLVSMSFAALLAVGLQSQRSRYTELRQILRVFLYSLQSLAVLLSIAASASCLLSILSLVYYATNTFTPNTPFPPWFALSTDPLEYILETPLIPIASMIWLLWYWAVVYTRHFQLPRWKFYYSIGVLLSLCSYFAFRGILA